MRTGLAKPSSRLARRSGGLPIEYSKEVSVILLLYRHHLLGPSHDSPGMIKLFALLKPVPVNFVASPWS